MPVNGEELITDLREYFGPDGARVERTFLVDWADRLAFIKEKLGYFDGSTLWLPDKYEPEGNESVGNLYARQADVSPLLDPSHDPDMSSGRALVKIVYGNIEPPPPGSTQYVTESLTQSSEYLTLPRKGLYFDTGGDKVSLEDYDIEVPTKIVPMLEWQYTVHRYLAIPTACLTLPGRINSSPVYSRSLGITFPAGTLLCGPIEISREYTSTGGVTANITWHFLYRNNGNEVSPKGWQWFPRTDGGAVSWERITDGTSEVPVYEEADFSSVVF